MAKFDMQTEIEAAAFRRLIAHLDSRKDVQNIDLMNLASFCRNCMSRWLSEEAEARGVELDQDAAREHVYGEAYADWKAKYQTESTADQRAAFEEAHKKAT